MIKEVEFPSEGVMLRGLLFLPESQTRRPPRVNMVADKYSEAFPAPDWRSCFTTTGTLGRAKANHGRRSILGFSAEVTVMLSSSQRN